MIGMTRLWMNRNGSHVHKIIRIANLLYFSYQNKECTVWHLMTDHLVMRGLGFDVGLGALPRGVSP